MRPLGTLIVQEQPCVCCEGNNAGKFRLDKLPLADPLRIDPQAVDSADCVRDKTVRKIRIIDEILTVWFGTFFMLKEFLSFVVCVLNNACFKTSSLNILYVTNIS